MNIDMARKVLLRCFVYSLIFIGLSVILYVTMGDSIYRIHGNIFSLSRHDIDLMFYNFLSFTKVFAIVVFLIPYIALSVTVKEKR